MSSPAWIPAGEAAEQLGVDRRTIGRWCETERIRCTKRGGQWWVDPADVRDELKRWHRRSDDETEESNG